MDTGEFNGITFAAADLESAVDRILTDGLARRPVAYRLVNSYSLALASKMPGYHQLLAGEGENLPDGAPLSRALRLTYGKKFGQVRGPSLFERCLDAGRSAGIRHYFLGGSEDTLLALTRRVEGSYPGIDVVGFASPPFRELSCQEIDAQDDAIRRSGAEIIWVGLGTPKQDFEAVRLSKSVGAVAVGVGAAFDFLAGTKREAPRWMRRMHLEWLFRLGNEPRRLWKRYLFGNLQFIVLCLRHFLQGRA